MFQNGDENNLSHAFSESSRERRYCRPIMPTGDPEADLAPAFDFFRTLVPRFPDKVLFPDGSGMDGPRTGS